MREIPWPSIPQNPQTPTVHRLATDQRRRSVRVTAGRQFVGRCTSTADPCIESRKSLRCLEFVSICRGGIPRGLQAYPRSHEPTQGTRRVMLIGPPNAAKSRSYQRVVQDSLQHRRRLGASWHGSGNLARCHIPLLSDPVELRGSSTVRSFGAELLG